MHFISMCALLHWHVEARACMRATPLMHMRTQCTLYARMHMRRAVAYLALCTPVRHYLARAFVLLPLY